MGGTNGGSINFALTGGNMSGTQNLENKLNPNQLSQLNAQNQDNKGFDDTMKYSDASGMGDTMGG